MGREIQRISSSSSSAAGAGSSPGSGSSMCAGLGDRVRTAGSRNRRKTRARESVVGSGPWATDGDQAWREGLRGCV